MSKLLQNEEVALIGSVPVVCSNRISVDTLRKTSILPVSDCPKNPKSIPAFVWSLTSHLISSFWIRTNVIPGVTWPGIKPYPELLPELTLISCSVMPLGISWLPVRPHPSRSLRLLIAFVPLKNGSSLICHAPEKDGKNPYRLPSPNRDEPSARRVA